MSYRIALCDDDLTQAQSLNRQVAAWARQTSAQCSVEIFPSGEALLFARETAGDWDILLLDVEMPGMTGLDLARRLRAEGCRSEMVFITSHFEFVGEGYEVDALHYLIKPVADEALFRVLSRAAQRLAVEPPFVLVTREGETFRLYESELILRGGFSPRNRFAYPAGRNPPAGAPVRLCPEAQPGFFPVSPLFSGESEGRAFHRPRTGPVGKRCGASPVPGQI